MAYSTVRRGALTGVEARGENIVGLLKGMGQLFRQWTLKGVLLENGIDENNLQEWYPLQSLLNVFDAIIEKGGKLTLERIGATVIDNVKWPQKITSFEEAINSIDIAYHMNHRRDGKNLFDPATGQIIEGQIGHNVFYPEKPEERQAVYVCGSFYPCEFDHGMSAALAKRFPPQEAQRAGFSNIRVIHDDTKPCRKTGGETCTYLIKW